ncbi:MAG TPA: hypothetical protein PL005_11265, partial [Candidatus Hydrogenedentes bacterium]|nr:hypothetical protein [Candidatus Hydrogenedentota bacterium]
PAIPPAARKPHAAPAAGEDVDEDVVEAYPKPRDTVFVYPDQSVSIAVPSRRRRGKVVVAAVFLAILALTGVGGFLVLQRPAADGTSGPAAPAGQTAAQPEGEEMLTMQFPEQSFGTLYDHNVPHTTDADWPVFGEAKGLIEYPKGAKFHLVVKKDQAKDLSPLGKLPDRALFSMWLPLLEPTEENMGILARLQGLSTLYIDQELDPALLDRLRGGMMGKTAVNCRQADALVRDMTPPGERVLNFPAEGIGYIDIRPWQQASESWQRLGSAAGAVTIPAKMEIRLEIAPGRTDLSSLASLDIMAVHTLTCEGPDITDVSMDGVAALRGILCLELSRTLVTNDGFGKIRRNTALEELKLVDTRVTDDGLGVLKNLHQLGKIHFEGAAGVTSRSIPLFRELRALRRLHLGNTGISGTDLAQLARDLPSCAITPK